MPLNCRVEFYYRPAPEFEGAPPPFDSIKGGNPRENRIISDFTALQVYDKVPLPGWQAGRDPKSGNVFLHTLKEKIDAVEAQLKASGSTNSTPTP